MIVIVAEKPSVARDIARVLGANQRREGYLEGAGYQVTWAIGHLVALASPGEMNAEWKKWDLSLLPMVPDAWELKVRRDLKKQFGVVKKLLKARATKSVVAATDAGREGELIFRYIYELTGSKKPVERLWISSLTEEAIRTGFRNLKSAKEFDALGDAATARSRADWLVGMNLSRYFSKKHSTGKGDLISVGRVQTPTLAMIVAREVGIQRFVPKPFLEVEASFRTTSGTSFRARWFTAGGEKKKRVTRLAAEGEAAEQAEAIASNAGAGPAGAVKVRRETKPVRPPQLYDLTELQREANRRLGLSAARTLELCQALYEKHKVLSYPRTDSRYLSADVERELRPSLSRLSERVPDLGGVDIGLFTKALGARWINDKKVSDHHAIVPTGRMPPESLSGEEAAVFLLVLRRTLAAYLPNAMVGRTDIVIAAGSDKHRFHASGSVVAEPGWQRADPPRGASGEKESPLPGDLEEGQSVEVVEVVPRRKMTKPPKAFTEATLLSAMESAGKSLDPELSDAMKERGLGTPATRAATLETLISRKYIRREKNTLRATEAGIRVVNLVGREAPQAIDPAMTGEWELRLRQMEAGQGTLDGFVSDVVKFVEGVVKA